MGAKGSTWRKYTNNVICVCILDVAAQYDTVDGAITADVQRNRQIAESLKQKIMKTR